MPEAIPALVYVIGLFFAIVGYITARGLLATWTHSLGYMFEWLAKELRFHVTILFKTVVIDLGGPFRAVDGWVRTALQNWCTGAEIEMGYFLHGLEELARYMAEAIDILARETAQTFDGLVNVHLPKWARNAIAVAFPLGYLAKLIADQVRKAVPAVRREIHTVTHEVTHEVTRVVSKSAAIALPNPWAFPRFRRAWRDIEAWRAITERRLRRLEALLAASGLALAVAKLWGVRYACVKHNGNIGRFMRGICGSPAWLLDLLLIGTVEGFAAADLCAFEGALIKSAQAIEPALAELVTVENVFVQCPAASYPQPLELPPVSLPALVDDVALAA